MKHMIGEPRVVEAGRGAAWWGEGFRLFASNFWTWIGIIIIYVIISMLIGIVPWIGTVGHWLLTPVFVGGLMLGCQSIERDGMLRVAHLFEGFQGAHFVPLMIIGVVNIALVLAIVFIGAGVFGGVGMAGMMSGGDPSAALEGMFRSLTGTGILLALVILVIGAVFAMLNWFAPALVALRGATAVEAMKLSFFACLRNWVPLLVYGLIAIAILVAAGLVFVGIALVIGAGAIMGAASGMDGVGAIVGVVLLFVALAALLVLVVWPIVFASQYAGYKDTLGADDAELGNPAYQ